MEELAAISPSELTFMGTSGIVLANETSAPNQNVLLNFTKFDVPLDGSKSNSTTSSDSKKGISYSLLNCCMHWNE